MRSTSIKRSLTTVIAASVIAAAGVTPSSAAPANPVRLDHGHADIFDLTCAGDSVKLQLKEDITGSGVHRAPEDVILVVKKEALQDIPGNFPGAPKGYVLDQSGPGENNLLWPGWDTLGIRTCAGEKAATDFEVESVDGPGKVYMFISGTFGGVQSRLKSGGYELPGTIQQPFPAHTHVYWVFSEAGRYTFKVKATVTKEDGSKLTTPVSTYNWEVGDIPAESKPEPGETTKPTEPKPGEPTEPGTPGETPTPTPTPDPTTPAPAPGTGETTPAQPEQPAPTQPGDTATPPVAPAPAPVPSKPTVKIPDVICKPVEVKTKTSKTIVTSGHFDLGVQMSGSTALAKLKDDRSQPAHWNNPGSYLFVLDSHAKKSLPAGYSFIGSAGTPVWMIGSTQEAGVPWLGVNSQHPTVVNGTTGEVKWDLVSVSGPGKMYTFFSGSLGAGAGQRVFDNAGGPRSYTIPANTHAHPNWVFTQAGDYTVVIRQTVTLANGTKSSATSSLHFAVGTSASNAGVITSTVYRDQHGKPCLPGGAEKGYRRGGGHGGRGGYSAGLPGTGV